MSAAGSILDRMLDPIGQALSPEAARRLVDLRADPVAQQRMDDLADAANEGRLSPEERAEYESLIAAAEVLALLQAKSRGILVNHPAAGFMADSLCKLITQRAESRCEYISFSTSEGSLGAPQLAGPRSRCSI